MTIKMTAPCIPRWPVCLLLCLGLLLAQAAHANCVITKVSQTEDDRAAKIKFGTINLRHPLLSPEATLLDSTVVPSTNYTYGGAHGGAVLWVCDKKDIEENKVYFMVSTNADDRFGGRHEIGGQNSGIYATWVEHIGLRQRMGGVTLSPFWQKVPLPDYLISSQANEDLVYIRLYDIPPLEVELHWIDTPVPNEGSSYCSGPARIPGEGNGRYYGVTYTCRQPMSYIQLVGPGIEHDQLGQFHESSRAWGADNGFGYTLWEALEVKKAPVCMVESADPYVRFRTVHVRELATPNAEVSTDFNITLICEEGALHGTNSGANYIGLQVSQRAFKMAEDWGFVNDRNGVEYLLSEHYGQPGIATGVGIELSAPETGKKGLFVGRPGRVDIGYPGGADSGWYPMMLRGNPVELPGGGHRISLRLSAKLKRLQGWRGWNITPGKVHATATVVVKVR